MLDRLIYDARYAGRSLRRSPMFSFTVVAVLAIGIGANAAVYSVAREVLFSPLPYPEPDRLVQIVSRTAIGRSSLASIPKFNLWKSEFRADRALTAYHGGGPGVLLTSGGRRQRLRALYVSSDYFAVFGAPFAMGRAFTVSEDRPQAPPVAIISWAYWQREYGTGRRPLGEMLVLGGLPHQIVGVLHRAFVSDPPADVWLPLGAPSGSVDQTNFLTVVARLRPAVTLEMAERQAANTTGPYRRTFPNALGPWEHFGVEPLAAMVAGDTRTAVDILLIAVVLVLMIACANAANLLAARAARKRADIATRAACGAGRPRLFRQMFLECLLLAAAAGVAGVAFGFSGMQAVLAISPLDHAPTSTALDWSMARFTFGMSLATALLFGLLPVAAASRVDLGAALKDSSSQTTDMGQRRRQSVLVLVELALAIVLLVGAGLLLRTFAERRSVDRGFVADAVLTLPMPLTDAPFRDTAAVAGLVQNVEQRLAAMSSVHSVAAAYQIPLQPSTAVPFILTGRSLLSAPYHGVARLHPVSRHYLEVFRIRLVRGRFFTEHDVAASEPAVVISHAMARKFWQGRDPVGERVLLAQASGEPGYEKPRAIVGVVADVKSLASSADPEPEMYVPLAQMSDAATERNNRFFPLQWIVRAPVDPRSIRTIVERELAEASGGMPVGDMRPMADIVRRETQELEFTTLLVTVFAAIALVLAAVGLYGLMAFSVQERTREFGIRVALGAEPARLRNGVLGEAVRLAAGGVLVGFAGTLAGIRAMGSLIFGLARWDAAVFATVAGLLGAITLIAAYAPARHAMRVDPADTLRGGV